MYPLHSPQYIHTTSYIHTQIFTHIHPHSHTVTPTPSPHCLSAVLLNVIRETVNEDVTTVLQKFVCRYGTIISPLAFDITTHLVSAAIYSTHTPTHSLAHPHTCTHAHTRNMHTHTLAHMHTPAHMHTHTPTHACTHSHTQARTHEHSYTLTLAHTQARTFIDILENESDPSDERAITAMGLLSTMETMVIVLEEEQEVLTKIESILLPVVVLIIEQDCMG